MPYYLQQHYREAARLRQAQADHRHVLRWLVIYAIAFAGLVALAVC